MANRTNIEKEKNLETVEELVILGFTTPSEIQRMIENITDFETAKRYISIARRRIRNKAKRTANIVELRDGEVRKIKLAEKNAWSQYYRKTTKPSDKAKFLSIIVKLMERKALLLGYDEPSKFLGAIIDGKGGKLKKNTLSQEEVTDLSKKLLRASNELNIEQKPSESDKNSGSKQKSTTLRADLPASLPNGKSADIPHGGIEQKK